LNIEDISLNLRRAHDQVARVVVGQRAVIEHVLIALLSRGHLLIEGVPGLGKTLLVRTLSHVLGAEFRRIQFTPDLMPSDVTGGNIFNQRENRFEFNRGPIFTQLLLADEVNRAPAKTQSALLEAMQERSVTVDGVTHPLPNPFLVIATQNPVESQGTYPLPEAQLDRFLFKVQVGHPSQETEDKILEHYVQGFDPANLEAVGLERVLSDSDLRAMQTNLQSVRVSADIIRYITEIVTRSRIHRSVYLGASPRASIGLLTASRARAALEGRDFVIPDDVKQLAAPVMRHRLLLQPDAELEGVSTDHVVDSILREVPVPQTVAHDEAAH